MTIEMLDTGTILVSMRQEDMRDYRIDFDDKTDLEAAKKGLTRLMYRVGEACGLDHRDKSYLIEALPSGSGCLLVISVHKTGRRRYRIKRPAERMVCVFDTADGLLDCLEKTEACVGYTLYLYRDRYVLLPQGDIGRRTQALLSEYGRVYQKDAVAVARVAEYGRLLLRRRARRDHPARFSSAAI